MLENCFESSLKQIQVDLELVHPVKEEESILLCFNGSQVYFDYFFEFQKAKAIVQDHHFFLIVDLYYYFIL